MLSTSAAAESVAWTVRPLRSGRDEPAGRPASSQKLRSRALGCRQQQLQQQVRRKLLDSGADYWEEPACSTSSGDDGRHGPAAFVLGLLGRRRRSARVQAISTETLQEIPLSRVFGWCRKEPNPLAKPSVTSDADDDDDDIERARDTQQPEGEPPTAGPSSAKDGMYHDSDTAANQKVPGNEPDYTPYGPVPVFVMLPLDVVTNEGVTINPKALSVGLQALKAIGVDGVMVDVWWGIAERAGPGVYDFSAYKQLIHMVKAAGLRMQVVMSFHSCGGNVGDSVEIPLPKWVLDSAAMDPNIFYTDRMGNRNLECISLFSDSAPVLAGRTPLQCYTDFMRAFRDAVWEDADGTLVEVSVGMGPCGELRYPAYPEQGGRWRFPGIGEFQCYDRRAMADLAECAFAAGHREWALSGPHDAGSYNDHPHNTGFFHDRGSWDTEYGRFFLSWYSGALLEHAEQMVLAAKSVFSGKHYLPLVIKCAGVHWWYDTRSHAAELTAGYYNTRERNGYVELFKMCARHDVHVKFTCVEMRDIEHPQEARCGPEGLLRQVRLLAAIYGVVMSGENALCRYDQSAYDSIIHNVYGSALDYTPADGEEPVPVPYMASFTFLRMEAVLFEEHNFPLFVSFVKRMKAGRQLPDHLRHRQRLALTGSASNSRLAERSMEEALSCPH
eukprot:jgi/Chlat1/9075/Chrsp94S08364